MSDKPISLREIKKNEKKQRIQEAAIHVMARNGYHGTTVSQIAKAARVADGTLYLYFENKDDLLIGIFESLMETFKVEAGKLLETIEDPVEQLKALANLHLRNLGSNEDLACIFQIELRHNARFMKLFSTSKLRDYFNLIEQIIRNAQARGQIRENINPWITTKIFFGALDEMATNWVLRHKDYDLATMAEPVLDILLNGMRAS